MRETRGSGERELDAAFLPCEKARREPSVICNLGKGLFQEELNQRHLNLGLSQTPEL